MPRLTRSLERAAWKIIMKGAPRRRKFFARPSTHCRLCGGRLGTRYVKAERCRRQVCAACGAVSYVNPKIVAAVLPLKNGKVYLLKRNIEPSRGFWTIPAGFMEMGETIEQAALRETREEIRSRAVLTGLHGLYSYPEATVVTVVYRGRLAHGKPRAGHETQAVKAFRPTEIPWKRLAFRSVFEALRDWVRSPENEGIDKTP